MSDYLSLKQKIEGVEIREILDLLTGAWEAGSEYWIDSIQTGGSPDYLIQPEDEFYPRWQLAPFTNGHLIIELDYTMNHQKKVLDFYRIKQGIKLMKSKHRRDYDDWREGDDDAATSDVFLQLCLFGEVIFG